MNNNFKIKISFNAPVVLSFVFLCLAVFVLGIITAGNSTSLLFSVYRSSVLDPLTYIRLFGHVLGHENWDHFIGNMLMILVIGPLLEEKYGSLNILFVILTTALVTGLAHILFFSNVSLLGASGVVFAFILLSSITSIKDGKIPLTFILIAVTYIGKQILDGIFIKDNISNLTHILGGGVGTTLGYVMNKYKMNRY